LSNTTDNQLFEAASRALQHSIATAPGNHQSAPSTWWSTTNAMTMCTALLVFFLIVLGLSTYLLRTGKSGAMVLRVFGTVLVISMTTFLVVAGYDDKQIAAPIGLLGTIVGYLLGRDSSIREDRERIENRTD
jgi:hypothetical protein